MNGNKVRRVRAGGNSVEVNGSDGICTSGVSIPEDEECEDEEDERLW